MTRLKFFLLALIFIIFLNGCGKNSYENNFETLEDLNKPQYKIGAVVGAASEPYVGKFFPNAEEKQFNGISDMTVALEQGQVDGIVYDQKRRCDCAN